METERTEFDLGEILRTDGQEYECGHLMFSEQRKAFRAIASCRTSVLGGHKLKCNKCSYEEISYNSCRNNNCPKCQGIKRKEWVEARIDELLPVPHFHVIFTISNFFNNLHNSYYKALYKEKLKAAKELTLLENFTLREQETPSEVLESLPAHLCSQCEAGTMEVVETLLPHGPPHIIFRNEIQRGKYAA